MKFSEGFQIYVGTVNLAAIALSLALLPTVPWEAWIELMLFLVLIVLASMFPISDPRGGYITAAPMLYYVLIAVHGPGAGAIIAGTAYAVGAAVSRSWIPWRTIFNGAQMGISVGLAGLVFKIAGGKPTQPDAASLLIPLALAVLTHQVANNFFVAFYFTKLRGVPLLSTWISDIRDLTVSNLLTIPTATLLAILYVLLHPLVLFVYLVLLPLQRRAHELYIHRKRVYDQAISSLVLAVDANFPQGRGHSKRVSNIAVSIARTMNLSDTAVEAIELGALLHDVGLIGLDELLDSPAPPDSSELARLREHARIGAEIVKELPRKDIAEIVLHHHERFDGAGYPVGLRGSRIPVGARIVAVAEVFDSMLTGGFPYSKKISPDEVIVGIRKESGTAFDPRVVEALVRAWESGALQALLAPAESDTVVSKLGVSSA